MMNNNLLIGTGNNRGGPVVINSSPTGNNTSNWNNNFQPLERGVN